MLINRIHVVKKNRVQTGTAVRLPLGRTPMAVAAKSPRSGGQNGGVTQVRIVESNSDYVILEMICGCGQKSFVQCNYGNVAGLKDNQEKQP